MFFCREMLPTLMKNILVIENQGIIRLNLLNILNNNEFKAIGAEDGLTGLRLARESVPDLILSNVKMPRLDGFKLLQQLRADPVTRVIPFIFITAQSTKAEIELGKQMGAASYITKPFHSSELIQQVNKILKV